jgi:hypothetical protein
MDAMKAVPKYDHWHVTQQLGFKPILYCWCGASCDLNKNSRKAIKAFKLAHDDCEQPQSDNQAAKTG